MQILDCGDKLYQDSIDQLQKNEKLENKFLLLSEILKKYQLRNKQVQFIVDECFINGVVNPKVDDLADLNKVKAILVDV